MEECDKVIVRGVGGKSRSKERWRREERDEGESKYSKGEVRKTWGTREVRSIDAQR